MNDRLKFRAFDTFAKKMIQNHISICEGELYEWCPDGLHIKHDIGDSAIVMQCTGLKDKNGKLIYEGDVVNGSCGVYWGKMIVEYNVAGFVLNKNGKRLNFLEGDNFIEVIGNIYENPELLKECE